MGWNQHQTERDCVVVIFLLFQVFTFGVHVCGSGIQAGVEGKVCIPQGQTDPAEERQTAQ